MKHKIDIKFLRRDSNENDLFVINCKDYNEKKDIHVERNLVITFEQCILLHDILKKTIDEYVLDEKGAKIYVDSLNIYIDDKDSQ
jgi:hypothetical protein